MSKVFIALTFALIGYIIGNDMAQPAPVDTTGHIAGSHEGPLLSLVHAQQLAAGWLGGDRQHECFDNLVHWAMYRRTEELRPTCEAIYLAS